MIYHLTDLPSTFVGLGLEFRPFFPPSKIKLAVFGSFIYFASVQFAAVYTRSLNKTAWEQGRKVYLILAEY